MRAIQGILIVYFGLGYFWVTGWYPGVQWLQRPPLAVLFPLVVGICGLLLLMLGRLFRRRDPVIVGWIALSLVGCLLTGPLLVAKFQQTKMDLAQDTRLEELRDEWVAQQRRQEQIQREAERRRRAEGPRDRFSQYEGRIDALSLQAIRVLDDQMEAEVNSYAEAYRSTLEANPILGPSAWITFRSLDQLQTERDAHQKLYEATRTFTRYIESFEEKYTAAMENLSLKPPADRIAIAEMERILQSWEANRTYDLRKLDVELLTSALNALDVLKDAWGEWSYSPRESQLSFEDPGMEARFQEAMQRFKYAFDSVEAIRKDEISTGE